MKGKLWIILLLILVVLGSAFCFREAFAVRLLPKVVLTGAIRDMFDNLETRFANSPIALVAGMLDPNGCQQVTMKLDTASDFMGIVHYDLKLLTQTDPNRVKAQGTVSTGAGQTDLNMYMDQKFAALASHSLTDGAWYGITFETFPVDIRGFQLLGLFLEDDTLKDWDHAVAQLGSVMRQSYKFPGLNAQDLRTALLGTIALKPSVAAEKGKFCYRITFTVPGPVLARKVQPYLNQAPDELAKLADAMSSDSNSELKLVFHLRKRQITGLDASIKLFGQSCDGSFFTEGSQLFFVLTQWDGENLDRRELSIDTVFDDNSYQEKLSARRTTNGIQSQFSAEYTWDISNGDIILEAVRDGKKYPIRLNLKGEGECITIYCQQFEQVLSLLTGKEKTRNAICSLTISPGEPVVPLEDYKNLSDWSVEDLYLLLTRLGSLGGINLP